MEGGGQNALMKVDTNLLLNTIRDIEANLSEHHRQDKMPPWASKLLGRLDKLESLNDDTYNKLNTIVASATAASASTPTSAFDNGGRPMGPGVNLQDLANDERILAKFKTELDLQVSNVKVSLESKVSGAALELDRLHKLLQIRPTTSELQQVVVTISDVNRYLNDSLKDISSNVKGIVQEKVAEQMSVIMDQLRSAETVNAQNYNLIIKKVDAFVDDVSTIRKDVESKFTIATDSMKHLQKEISATEAQMNNFRSKIDDDNKKSKDVLDAMKFSQQMAQELVSDYRTSISSQLSLLTNTVANNESTVQELKSNADTRYEMLTEIVTNSKDAINEFKALYELDMGVIRSDCDNQIKSLAASLVKQDEIESYIAVLKEKNVMKVLNDHEASITTMSNSIHDVVEKIKAINTRTSKISKNVTSLDNLIKGIPESIATQMKRVDTIVEENTTLNTAIDELDRSVLSAQSKLKSIQSLQLQLDKARERLTTTDNKIKTVQTGIVGLNEISYDHGTRIENVINSINCAQEDANKRINEVKIAVTELLTEKQAEIDASVQSMKEKLDAISNSAGDDNNNGGSDGGINNSIGIGASLGRAGRGGMGMMSKAGGKGGKGGKGSSDSTSGMSKEDQSKVTQSQAQFIADLCINFEEIAIRKSQVTDIPPTMCEHITATSQALTSFIATCTDAEMIQKVLSAGPEESEYEEDVVADKRQQKLNEVIEEVLKCLNTHNNQPSIVRFEARDKFVKQLKKALQICMSKHDQVLIVGNSRLGKLKIPSCIACDRPLIEKVRSDRLQRGDDASQRSFVPYFGHGIQSDESLLPVQSPTKKGSQVVLIPRTLNTVDFQSKPPSIL